MRPLNASEMKTAHLCMITAHRERSYVQETTGAILAQLEHDGLGSRLTLSINVVSGWDRIDNPLAFPLEHRAMASGTDCLTNEDTDPLPPCGVRQQGLDVANALTACHRRVPGTDWVILMEDDFMPCDHALTGVLETLDTLDPHKIKFARFTQGNGVVAFPQGNVLRYTQSILDNIGTIPCDRVLLEPWSLDSDYVFPRHLFKHIGAVSTIGYRNKEEYVREYSSLRDNECGNEIRV